MARVIVSRGRDPLPFFAEYAYYLWGEVNYDSDGDCSEPTDRAWKRLVDPGVLTFLRKWHAQPPRDFHQTGVAFALEFLGKLTA